MICKDELRVWGWPGWRHTGPPRRPSSCRCGSWQGSFPLVIPASFVSAWTAILIHRQSLLVLKLSPSAIWVDNTMSQQHLVHWQWLSKFCQLTSKCLVGTVSRDFSSLFFSQKNLSNLPMNTFKSFQNKASNLNVVTSWEKSPFLIFKF